MRRKALLLFSAAILAFAAAAHAQTSVLLYAFEGFDYQDPNPNTNPDPGVGYLDVGEGYKAVGFVTSVGPDLQPYFEPAVKEYTYHAFGLTVAGRAYFDGFLEVTFADGGRARYYADPIIGGTRARYGVNPPNATAPAAFIDGTLEVGGRLYDFVLTYDFYGNQGNFYASMNIDEGAQLSHVTLRNGWTMAGLAGRPNATVPTGYDNQVLGECRIPNVTPTTHKTWGAVKALYR